MSLWSNADRLEDMGDAFFGIGSIVGVMLCDLHFDDDLAHLPIVSAVLWLMDALFYLRSDFCTLYSQTANSYEEFDTAEMMDDDSSLSTTSMSESGGSSRLFYDKWESIRVITGTSTRLQLS